MFQTDHILHNGRFRITKIVGEADHATIFEAIDALNDVAVSIVVCPQSDIDPPAIEDSIEPWIGSRHENILSVRGHFQESGRHILVTEPINGVLADMVDGSDRASVHSSNEWAAGLFQALEYLHGNLPSVIHGDITPSRLAIVAGKIKLMPPLVAAIGADEKSNGTPGIVYQPIERIWNTLGPTTQRVLSRPRDGSTADSYDRPPDAGSDIYSAAATIYFMLTGQPPIDALERTLAIFDGDTDPLRPPVEIDPSISAVISSLIVKCLSIKPEDRFSSAATVRRIINTCIADNIEPARTVTIAEPIASEPVEVESKPMMTAASEPVAAMADVAPSKTALPPIEFDLDELDNDILEIDVETRSEPNNAANTDTVREPKPEPAAPIILDVTAENRSAEMGDTDRVSMPLNLSVETAGAGSSPMRYAAYAAAAVVAIVVGVFAMNFISGSTSASQPEPLVSTVPTEQQTSAPVQSIAEPSPEPPVETEPEKAASTETTDRPQAGRNSANPSRTTRQAEPEQAEKPKKPTQVAEKKPEKKRTLTVDDLLNDR